MEDRILSQLRTSLHSTLPHEFFTPLAGIVGLANILRTTRDVPEVELREIYNDIYFSGLRLHRSLRNYLEILDVQQDAAKAEDAAIPRHRLLRPAAIREKRAGRHPRRRRAAQPRSTDISSNLEELLHPEPGPATSP